MLGETSLEKMMRLHLKQQETYGTSPFTYSKQEDWLLLTDKKKLRFEKPKFLIFTLFCIGIWTQLYLDKGKTEKVIQLESLYFAGALSIILFSKRSAVRSSPQIVELYNIFVNHEQKCLEGAYGPIGGLLKTPEKRLLQFYFLFGMCASPFAAFGYCLQRFIFPCNMATVGYFLLPECNDGFSSTWSIQSLTALSIYCMLLFWVFTDGFGVLAFYMTGISFTQAYSIFAYTKYFTKCLEMNLTTKRHSFLDLLSVYRQLQLLTRYFNMMQQQAIIFVILILIPMSVIFGVYTLVAIGSQISLPEFILFFCAGFDGLVVVIVYFSVMAKVNCGAEDALQFIKRSVAPRISGRMAQKWVRVFLASLKDLRVCIGSVNYVDKLTPFSLLDFCVTQIVNLLLMQ